MYFLTVHVHCARGDSWSSVIAIWYIFPPLHLCAFSSRPPHIVRQQWRRNEIKPKFDDLLYVWCHGRLYYVTHYPLSVKINGNLGGGIFRKSTILVHTTIYYLKYFASFIRPQRKKMVKESGAFHREVTLNPMCVYLHHPVYLLKDIGDWTYNPCGSSSKPFCHTSLCHPKRVQVRIVWCLIWRWLLQMHLDDCNMA